MLWAGIYVVLRLAFGCLPEANSTLGHAFKLKLVEKHYLSH